MLSDPPPLSLKEHVRCALEDYFAKLDGEDASQIYAMVLAQIEPPMLEIVMKQAGNQVRAARFLGLNRGTLRKLLAKYALN